jgi:hypothetical protein
MGLGLRLKVTISKTQSSANGGSSKICDQNGKTKAARGATSKKQDAISVSKESRKDNCIDSMFDYLAIGADEFADFAIKKDDATLAETTRWIVVARVLTDKNFGHVALFQQMQNAWDHPGEIILQEVGDNKIVVQCFLLRRLGKCDGERGPCC